MTGYSITETMDSADWPVVADLIAESIPNALISRLGVSFGSTYYRRLSEHRCSCCYTARNAAGEIEGVIIGSTDYPAARSTVLKENRLRLLLCANIRLLHPSVLAWVLNGVVERFRPAGQPCPDRPPAELAAIAVRPQARGSGIAADLVKAMEAFMTLKPDCREYVILTEKANTRANRFYEKIGARLVRTTLHHSRPINQWHKNLQTT